MTITNPIGLALGCMVWPALTFACYRLLGRGRLLGAIPWLMLVATILDACIQHRVLGDGVEWSGRLLFQGLRITAIGGGLVLLNYPLRSAWLPLTGRWARLAIAAMTLMLMIYQTSLYHRAVFAAWSMGWVQPAYGLGTEWGCSPPMAGSAASWEFSAVLPIASAGAASILVAAWRGQTQHTGFTTWFSRVSGATANWWRATWRLGPMTSADEAPD